MHSRGRTPTLGNTCLWIIARIRFDSIRSDSVHSDSIRLDLIHFVDLVRIFLLCFFGFFLDV